MVNAEIGLIQNYSELISHKINANVNHSLQSTSTLKLCKLVKSTADLTANSSKHLGLPHATRYDDFRTVYRHDQTYTDYAIELRIGYYIPACILIPLIDRIYQLQSPSRPFSDDHQGSLSLSLIDRILQLYPHAPYQMISKGYGAPCGRKSPFSKLQ